VIEALKIGFELGTSCAQGRRVGERSASSRSRRYLGRPMGREEC